MSVTLDECCGCIPALVGGRDIFELYTEGDKLYAAMADTIAAARESVRLESYIFADDEIGRRLVNVLAKCARNGIDVRVHLDAAGSLFWSSRRLARSLLDQGVRVRWFHRWNWRRPWRYNRRNHRKLLVVDRRQAYLGGFNIHRESSRDAYGDKRWRDTHVRIQGPLAAESAYLFDAFWRGHRRWVPRDGAGSTSVLVPNHSRACRHRLRCIYTDSFTGARERVYLTTPYFVPDVRIQRRLMEAAQRGIDVRLLVPGKSDVPLTRWAAHAAYASLLAAGVRIYEYLPRMLHTKTAVIDGTWAIMGTANLDYRSFFLNYELNLVTRDDVLCRRLEQQFLADLAESQPILAEQWAKRHWPERLLESVGWLARRWL